MRRTHRWRTRSIGVEGVQFAAVDMHGDDPSRLPLVVHQQIHHLILIEEGDVVLDTLLVHRLKDHVAGAIRGVQQARRTGC